MFSGRLVSFHVLRTLQSQTPFLRSENYRRLPEDSLYTGIVRELAGMPMKHLDGIIDDSSVST